MSRLDSAIRRLCAQRDCLDWAVGAIAGLDGPILELGLGNGRTYDHLRQRMPDREILVFDRQVNAHPDCIPDQKCLFLGEMTETLPATFARLGPAAVLAHCDLGSGDRRASAALASAIAPHVVALMRPGGLVVSDQEFKIHGLDPLALPEGVPAGRYFLYRAAG